MIFEIDNIELKYDIETILGGIYLRSEAGKITGLLGLNGTGKTSLLKIFFGSLKPQNKLVRINGKPFLKPLFTSGLVKYLPQHQLIPYDLKIRKAFRFYKVEWEDFTALFPEFEKYADAKMNLLSGGEKRVVEIYLCLKSPSEIILLDEPFSHVSPVFIEKLKPLMISEKEKKAIVMTDHMYRHIIDLADDLYLLKSGHSRLVKNLKELVDQQYLSPNSIEA